MRLINALRKHLKQANNRVSRLPSCKKKPLFAVSNLGTQIQIRFPWSEGRCVRARERGREKSARTVWRYQGGPKHLRMSAMFKPCAFCARERRDICYFSSSRPWWQRCQGEFRQILELGNLRRCSGKWMQCVFWKQILLCYTGVMHLWKQIQMRNSWVNISNSFNYYYC